MGGHARRAAGLTLTPSPSPNPNPNPNPNQVRPQSLQPLTPMRSLKSDKIGKLVAVRGSVIRVSSLRPMVSLMGC